MEESSEGKFAALYDLFFERILDPVRRQHVLACKKFDAKRIIDMGCGTGSQCQLFSKYGFHSVGIDISEQMLNVARSKKIAKADFLNQDILNNSFHDGAFDCVSMTLVLHANNKETITAILGEAKRLTHNGIIIITDYDKSRGINGFITSIIIRIVESFARPLHRSSYFAFMKRGGLEKIIREEGYTPKVYSHYYGGSLKTFIIKE